MKKNFTRLILLLFLFLGCEKSELGQPDLKGTLKGELYTLDEFGNQNNENENIALELEGSEPLLSVLTDSMGKYEIKDIPSGTYNLIISKDGYGEIQRQGIQIVGGNEYLYLNGSIIEKSSTTIENFTLEIVNGSGVSLKGIVNHNFIANEWGYTMLNIRYFIHNTDNPSDTNYLETGAVSFNGESGSILDAQIYIDKKNFPSGSNINVIVYGSSFFESSYYDILSNQFIYTSLGTGSNIASITLP